MNFVEQLQQLDFKDIGRWPFLFRALGVLVVFVFMTILLVWWFVWSDNGNRPALLRARAEQVSLWGTFDQKQRKAANLEAYRQQLAEIERTFGAMLRQLPGKTEVPSLLVDISQTGLAAGLQERLFQPGTETRKDFYAELPIKIQLTGGYHEFGAVRVRHRGAPAHRDAARHRDHAQRPHQHQPQGRARAFGRADAQPDREDLPLPRRGRSLRRARSRRQGRQGQEGQDAA